HIGQILELIDSHLSAYKTVLEQYDLLIKSRFVELFGDVVLNTLNWPLVKLSAIAEYRIGLTYKPEAVSSSGIAVLRSGNIQNSQLCYEDTIYVNSKVEPKLLLKKNDILMCARNGSQSLVGKVALIENDISNTTYGAFMMAISSKYYVYLFEYFRSQAFRRLISVGSTTTINQVTTRMLNSIVIPLPDLDNINRFALYHSQINKLKSDVQKSIDETQLLMDSLMQEYFG
ncbi:MAG: restriction endonuclease subunit S, partial [Veillonella sp.]|nr:restriction endonuclease subunit S [Veillonella sp.]